MISKLEHPLEMLSTEEISLAYEIYKTSEGYDEATHFSQISLVEPSKEFLKDFKLLMEVLKQRLTCQIKLSMSKESQIQRKFNIPCKIFLQP